MSSSSQRTSRRRAPSCRSPRKQFEGSIPGRARARVAERRPGRVRSVGMAERDFEATRSDEESAFDEYLRAAVRGDAEDLAAFCARHGDVSGDLRRRIEAFQAAIDAPAAKPLPFERLGDFRLVSRFGEGAMGVVYLAEQISLGRRVALKVIRPERSGLASAEARFQREAQALARLRHPHVVTVFAAGEDRGVRYLAMELVPGRGLDEALAEAQARGETIPVPTALRWAAQIARALECAHAAGIVHRDVKPSNVRIAADGRALLLDFGLARDLESGALTATSDFRGTPYYASPEQVEPGRGEIDARTDVYGLGALLYECLTGRPPFVGETTEQVFHLILSKEPRSPREIQRAVTRDVETVVLTAMEKEPARRYATAAELADDLEALLEVRPIRARPAGP